jgi:hypothetical protein
LLSAVQLAARLDIPVNWIYVQIRRKRLLIDQQSTGAYLFQNSPAVVNAVRDLRNRTIHQLDLRIIQPHQEGHQHALSLEGIDWRARQETWRPSRV